MDSHSILEITGTAPGELLGGVYPVVRLLGRGGFGEVYLCNQPAWNIEVAVKVPNREALTQGDILRWLQREAEAWTNLGLHPHVAYCYHLHPVRDVPLLVVEYVPGGTLLDYLRRKDNPAANNPRASVDLALQMCHALEHAHQHGVIHRDLKPENMLLTADGLVKLTDFGIAQIGAVSPEGQVGQTGAGDRRSFWGGTEGYAAPEQYDRSGEIDGRADLFGLGVCLYELFCGRRPYAMTFGARQAPPDPAQLRRDGKLPAGLAPLLRHLVAWKASERPASAKVVLEELAKIYEGTFGEPSHHAELPPFEMTASGHNNRGVSFHFLGKVEAAEAAFSQALEADPLHPEATYNWGVIRWRRGELMDTALISQLQQIRLAKINWRAMYLLGLVHLERHDREAAVSLLAEAAQAAPDQKEVSAILTRTRGTPDVISAGLVRAFKGHNSRINSVVFSVDGRHAVSGSGFPYGPSVGQLRLWDVADGECLRIFEGHTETVRSVAVSPDGQNILSGSNDGTVRLWDLENGKCLRKFEERTGRVRSVAFSPDGRLALSGWEKTLRLWELESGECIRTFEGHPDAVIAVAFSPDGQYILSAGADTTLRLWDAASGNLFCVFEGASNNILGMALSSDGRLALSGNGDQILQLWDVASGKCLKTLQGHRDSVPSLGYAPICYSVAISPDGRQALSGSWDKNVRLWNLETGKCLRTFKGHTGGVQSVALSPDGQLALSGAEDGTLRLWTLGKTWGDYADLQLAHPEPLGKQLANVQERTKLLTKIDNALTEERIPEALLILATLEAMPGQRHNLKVVAMRRQLMARCRRGGVRAGWPLQELRRHECEVLSVALSPDGQRVLSGGQRILSGGIDTTMCLWDVASGKRLRIFGGHTDGINSVAISPSGRRALSGSEDKTLRFWNLESGECLRTFEGHSDAVNAVAFSPDERWALSGSRDKTLRLWDLETGQCLRTFEGHNEAVSSVAISPDGRQALLGSRDKTLRLWDLAIGQCLRTFEGHNDAVSSVAISPDGRQALSGSADNTLRLWDLASGKCLRVFAGHTNGITSVAFSADGRYAVSGSKDSIRVWQVENADCLHVVIGRERGKISVLFSPDATLLLVAQGESIRVWHLDWELLPPPSEP